MIESWIHFVRHGETTGQSSKYFFGRTDIPLSDTGREQIKKIHPLLAKRRLRAAFTSALSRARESAQILLHGSDLQPIEMPAFNEVNFGILEGKCEAEIEQEFPEFWRLWRLEKLAQGYPEGDTFRAFQQKVIGGALTLEQEHGLHGEILIVAHRGVIRHLLGHFLLINNEESRTLAPELGQLISIKKMQQRWSLASLE